MSLPKNKKSTQANNKGHDKVQLIHDHIWKHFELNAKQRISLFNYYVLFFSFFAVGYYHIHDAGFKQLVFLVLIMFIIITAIFHLLEERNKQLVESAVKELEEFETNYLPKDKYKIFNRITKESEHIKIRRHGFCYFAIFMVGYTLSVILFVYELWKVWPSPCKCVC